MFVGSPDSVRGGDNSPININRVTLISKENLTAILLALSILVNVALLYAWRDTVTDLKVHLYDDKFFRDHDFAELKSDVRVQQRLLDHYAKCTKE